MSLILDAVKWDHRYLMLAREIALWSKDPSTQCGAVIVRPDKTIASLGYNGFPRGIADSSKRLEDREMKYALTIHAEVNALLNAHGPVSGYTLYVWPFQPCDRCAVQLIQAGITRVVSILPSDDHRRRWGDAFARAAALLDEAGVMLDIIAIN